MVDTDTSSYPRGTLPVSPLELAGKLGAIQQQKLGIDQAKLDQANQGLTYLTRAMTSLGPLDTPDWKDKYKAVGQNAVDMGLVPQNMLHIWDTQVDSAPDGPTFFKHAISAVQSHQQQLENYVGKPGSLNTGQTEIPTRTPGFTGAPVATGLPVQMQAPPTSVAYDENNQPRAMGAQPPQLAPGTVASPTPLPAARPSLPVERPTGPIAAPASTAPATFAQRTDAAFPKPQGAATGPAPLFEEGKKAYTEDQLSSSVRSQSIKPAIQALKLMPGLATGPGTAQFNDLVAAAKAWGIVDTKAENDPTVLRQEIEKKLAQYVGSSPIGQRSDAAQALAEAGSPNPKKQIMPALQALTRDAVALDRVNILKPQAFKGSDYQNYIKHQGTFPGKIDEKALTLDMLPEEQRAKLVNKMVTQYKNGDADEKARANKFLDTLKLASEHKIYEGAQ